MGGRLPAVRPDPARLGVRPGCEHAFVMGGLTPNDKGAIAELAIAKEAARLGLGVLSPLVEHLRYDLVLDVAGRMLRVQSKWAAKQGEIVRVKLECSRHSPRAGYVRTRYGATEIDAVAAYCEELDTCYLL